MTDVLGHDVSSSAGMNDTLAVAVTLLGRGRSRRIVLPHR